MTDVSAGDEKQKHVLHFVQDDRCFYKSKSKSKSKNKSKSKSKSKGKGKNKNKSRGKSKSNRRSFDSLRSLRMTAFFGG